jgi:ATP-dependent helicase/nuclease subunit B
MWVHQRALRKPKHCWLAQMFDALGPHIFGLPPGADFPAELVQGLRTRLAEQPPEAMAKVQLYVNTSRMRRRILDLFCGTGAGFLPQVRLVTEIGQRSLLADLPAAISPLRRRLELAALIAPLIDADPSFAPRAAIYDLADSLANLMDEMQGEGVDPKTISALDVENHSDHWKRTQKFLSIVTTYLDQNVAPDTEAHQRLAIERLTATWITNPPRAPVIIAGSTGSRGTTALLMHAVARLPQGALVLPGFDFDMPPDVWAALDTGLVGEDHPQYRFRTLLDRLSLPHSAVEPWTKKAPPNKARNALIALSMRPAPVTDQWLTEGPNLQDLAGATADMTLIEAASPRAEALAIALILRKAAHDGRTAALITPDRGLTRQVTAALDRWRILPDDSAGRPLALSAPGRLLRHVAGLFGQRLSGEALLTLLKHPLTFSGADRGLHLKLSRDLELLLRRHGPAFPTGADLVAWAKDDAAKLWATAIAAALDGVENVTIRPFADHIAHHQNITESLARGTAPVGTGTLWAEIAGIKSLKVMQDLKAEAAYGADMSPQDYNSLFTAYLSQGEVRDPTQPHPHIMIWGTLEARVQGADLVILGGLNDGSWPKLPNPDPWLNRDMRQKAGLLLPDRQIGLSAHDYQQAIAAHEVVLTRAHRNADAETVASRWLNRLTNLLDGLPKIGGDVALKGMLARGDKWMADAAVLEATFKKVDPAPRPAPRPPVAHRPTELYVTNIAKLIRDPYAIYARYILRLYPLDPLRQTPDARLRGQILHAILERFVKDRPVSEPFVAAKIRLLQTATDVLAAEVPFPASRALWLARLDRAAEFLLDFEANAGGKPSILEDTGSTGLNAINFSLKARPDRIDMLPDGRLHIIDYKTGTPPTEKVQLKYDNQLLLQAAMAQRGGFGPNLPTDVARITYVGLGSVPKTVTTEMTDELTGEVWEKLTQLISKYLTRDQGYQSRRAIFEDRSVGDYDHLARHGEWQQSDFPKPENVGQ